MRVVLTELMFSTVIVAQKVAPHKLTNLPYFSI